MDALTLVTWIVAFLACILILAGLAVLLYILLKYYRKDYTPIQQIDRSGEGRYSHVFYEREKPEIHRNSEAASNLDVVELRNNIIKNCSPRRSQSLLDIPHHRKKIDEGNIPLLPRKEEFVESQYFDCQEYLEPCSEDEYEDLEEDRFDEIEELPAKKHHKKKLRKLTKEEKMRVNALKIILLQQKRLEGEMHREIFLLEAVYDKKKEDIYQTRRKLIEGEPVDPESDPNIERDPGIPGYWLKVLLNSRNLKNIVQATDIPALENLVDISVTNLIQLSGFRINFSFRENEYFRNIVLTKDYLINFMPPEDASFLQYEGPQVVQCEGCKVQWNRHKNLTIRPVKKLQNHKIITKFARKNSFFNFFNPPALPEPEHPQYQNKKDLLEAHIQIGLFIKEYIVPKSYLFFTVPDFDKEIEKNVGRRIYSGSSKSGRGTPRKLSGSTPADIWKLSTSKIETPSAKKLSISNQDTGRKSVLVGSTGSSLVNQDQETEIVNNIEDEKEKKIPDRDINDNKSCSMNCSERVVGKEVHDEGETEEEEEGQEEGDRSGSNGILRNGNICVEIDPLPGKYKMESSEMFDEFLKALGVGMVRRRLAGSVVPINVVEIDQDGLYTIKTLTTVRSTEISFRLGEPFIEDTLDGRRATTTATRTGNLLTLDQVGNPGEKNTVFTREVEGDIMIAKLTVENVTCTRVYKRMEE
ncbi:uncharacterized protein LOC111709776 [Eurytemora carolleeae]|uniref:uncharacterized protein LOC111709776 n=1 Tax=Eurytemora carolleeae TaxID=1294199 RepID=UPI000C793D40|nr:uncharacterized protein LOC111709776 [Eurytemora carolleeae]|eukprot:XP_023339448.1 uncharacterized protein LOC111709776 [Eurytemora affinis]